QFAGGLAGITVATALLRPWIAAPTVNFVATLPGTPGPSVAFAAEFAIAALLMTIVLHVSAQPGLARYTGLVVGVVVAVFITVEDPLSGMSMTPARSFGPAMLAGRADTLWIYFLAPPLGMWLAAELFARHVGFHVRHCARLHHPHHDSCVFGCRERA